MKEESRTDEKDDNEGDLRRNQHATVAAAISNEAARACAREEFREVDARGRQGRKDAEDDAGDEAYDDEKSEGAEVERNALHVRNVAGVKLEQGSDEKIRESNAYDACCASEQE